ncbi:putative methyltransferase-domain-containing protein [Radiomyces spectabilis]|uniref:putative methyltransferase-domain-containing protein n=1 Tax=Radiomyces spectabilis TaxID=64574 RepID=UPI00221E91A2|nr:putative methyltransferase-domain-containing protein [Radiomyces spectabilis]KAI8391323.1 putative methyltransferase-domain-containing protein [Radiomyces spectabilis]
MPTPLYYIRFAKPPPVQCVVNQPFTVVWNIENDLGDMVYWHPVPVMCRIEASRTDVQLRLAPAQSKGSKSKPISVNQGAPTSAPVILTYDPARGGGMVTRLMLESAGFQGPMKFRLIFELAAGARQGHEHNVWRRAFRFDQFEPVWIIPTWSVMLHVIKSEAHRTAGDRQEDKQAERTLIAKDQQLINIREDAFQSIARHVWDCGLAMCHYISYRIRLLQKYQHIIELGSGTGLVGIYFASLLEPRTMYLTDLADSIDIVEQNVTLMEPGQTNVVVEALEWGDKKATPWMGPVDLILLTDVLYNQGSHDVLLDTVDRLMRGNTKTLLAYKERNPDERVFFTKIKERGWRCVRDEDTAFSCEIYWIEPAC